MGNDSTYTITVGGAKKEIDALLLYIGQKTERWERWSAKAKKLGAEKRAKSREREMKKHGIEKRAGFVTWGFTVEGREDRGEESVVTLGGWANENSTNCYISGEDGELAVMYELFPSLEYSVDYTDDYSQGVCAPPYFEKQEVEDEDGSGQVILEIGDIEIFLESDAEGGEGTSTTSFCKYLGAGVAEYIAQRLDRVIDLSGLEYITDDEAQALATVSSEKLKLSKALEKYVDNFRKKRKGRRR
jgi:hypothetical protein